MGMQGEIMHKASSVIMDFKANCHISICPKSKEILIDKENLDVSKAMHYMLNATQYPIVYQLIPPTHPNQTLPAMPLPNAPS